MIYAPLFQVDIGSDTLTSLPPKYVKSYVYTSTRSSFDSVVLTLVDPTYEKIEKMLLMSDDKKLPVYMRYGYVDPKTKTPMADWFRGSLLHYLPSIGDEGMGITATFWADGYRPTPINGTFTGKISDVAVQIAKDLDLELCFEETDDDYNLTHEDFKGGPKEWSSNNRSMLSFLKDLSTQAKGLVTGNADYTAFISAGTKSKKSTLHFHSRSYDKCTKRKKGARNFTYLAGKQNYITSFDPEYNSKLLGSIGAGYTNVFTYSNSKKQYNTESVVVDENYENKAKLITAKKDEEAEVYAKFITNVLKTSTNRAATSLVGLPETSDLAASQLINIDVLIPTGRDKKTIKKHWTSGLYLTEEVVHTIESDYSIACQLSRADTINAEIIQSYFKG